MSSIREYPFVEKQLMSAIADDRAALKPPGPAG
jgi:hypothetical protein